MNEEQVPPPSDDYDKYPLPENYAELSPDAKQSELNKRGLFRSPAPPGTEPESKEQGGLELEEPPKPEK